MKKNEIILFVLFIIGIISVELFFFNPVFMESLFNGNINMKLYVVSKARLFIYLLFTIIMILTKKRILNNCTEKRGKLNTILYIISIVITLVIGVYLKKCHKMNVMTIGIIITFIDYITTLYLFHGKNHKINILLICLISLIYTISVGPFHVLDEVTHVPTSYNLAQGNFNTKKMYFDPSLDQIKILSHYYDNKSLFVHYTPVKKDYSKYETVYKIDNVSLHAHIPTAIGIKVSEKLNGTIMDTFYIGRLFNTIVLLGLLIILLKTLKFKKYSILAIATIPELILLGSTYNLDGIGNMIIAIFISYVINIYFDKDIKFINYKNLFIIFLLSALICFFKGATYFIILGLLFLIRKKIPKKMYKVVVPMILIIGLLIYYNMFGSKSLDSGDVRGGNTNIKEQLKFLLSSPYVFFKVYFLHFMNTFFNPVFYTNMHMDYFYGGLSTYMTLPIIIYMIYMGLDDEYLKIKKFDKIFIILIFFAIFCFTSTALYLDFTPVGKTIISGYQSRYVFPILILLLTVLSTIFYFFKISYMLKLI